MQANEYLTKIKETVAKLTIDQILETIGKIEDRVIRAAMITRYEEACGEDAADELMERLGM